MKKHLLLGLAVLLVLASLVKGYWGAADLRDIHYRSLAVIEAAGNPNSTNYVTTASIPYVAGIANNSETDEVGFYYALFYGVEISMAFTEVWTWNGSLWRDFTVEDIDWDCFIYDKNCEPMHQNASTSQPIIHFNLTEGELNVTGVDLRLNDTCTWINITAKNDTADCGILLNTSWQEVFGRMTEGDNFSIFLYLNYSPPTGPCALQPEFRTRG